MNKTYQTDRNTDKSMRSSLPVLKNKHVIDPELNIEVEPHQLIASKNKNYKQLSIDAIETWLNNTLRNAEYFDVPAAIKYKEKGATTAIQDYLIDRRTLFY